MVKKLLKLMAMFSVFGVLAFGVGCSDYDDDINDLQEQVNSLSSQVAALDKAIKSGAVITSVTSTANGVTVTTSDGKSFTITNGKDGKDGVDGEDGKDGVNGTNGTNGKDGKDGTVWTIGPDGYWYQDNVKTDFKAVPENGQDGKDGVDGVDGEDGKDGVDGEDGEDGKDGNDGKDGKDGKDGSYWKVEPRNGSYFFVEYRMENGKEVKTETPEVEIVLPAGAEGGVTAIWNTKDFTLTINGAAGAEGPVVIYLATTLKSLAFVPETIFDGLGVISVKKFNYPEVSGKNYDRENGYPFLAAADSTNTGKLLTTPLTTATYRFNPQNVNPADYKFDFINRTVVTRAEADAFDLIKIVGEPALNNNGLLDVKIELTKDLSNETLDRGQTNDIVALRAIAKDKNEKLNEYIVSDYAYVEQTEQYWNYYIVHKDVHPTEPNNAPFYYRKDKFVAIDEPTDYNNGIGIEVDDLGVWAGETADSLVANNNPATVALKYNEEVDLLEYVSTYCKTYEDVVDSVLNVKYEFLFAGLDANGKVVAKEDGTKALYETQDGDKTNQNAFVALNGSKIKVKDQYGIAAVNRTPLVYVASYVEKDGVKKYLAEAFIKIQIIEDKPVVTPTTHKWDVFIIHDVTFGELPAVATYTGVSGTVTAPRQDPVYKDDYEHLNVDWDEVNKWVLADKDVKMPYAEFGKVYDLNNPKIILKKGADGLEEADKFPEYGDTAYQLEDFSVIGTYYKGVSGDKLSPTNWEQSTNIVNIKLDNTAKAGKHYVYVVFQSINDRYPDVVFEFIYTVPAHVHSFKLFEWILNPDYVLYNNPEEDNTKLWKLNSNDPGRDADADETKYGIVRVKGQENENQSGLIEHFKEYKVAVDTTSNYIFEIRNYTKDKVDFFVDPTAGVGTVGTVTEGTNTYATVTLSGAQLQAVMSTGADKKDTPYIVLPSASRLETDKEILVKVTEVCQADNTQTEEGYYYVVFQALKATINFNKIAFGTYKEFSDYALLHEIIKNVVDANGKDIIKWNATDKAWKLDGEYANIAATNISVAIDNLTWPNAANGDTKESFGGRIYKVPATDAPVAGYTVDQFGDAGIEWWNLGTDLQNDKIFGATVTIKITVDGTEIKLVDAVEVQFTVLSTDHTKTQKPNPNHKPDGKLWN